MRCNTRQKAQNRGVNTYLYGEAKNVLLALCQDKKKKQKKIPQDWVFR